MRTRRASNSLRSGRWGQGVGRQTQPGGAEQNCPCREGPGTSRPQETQSPLTKNTVWVGHATQGERPRRVAQLTAHRLRVQELLGEHSGQRRTSDVDQAGCRPLPDAGPHWWTLPAPFRV